MSHYVTILLLLILAIVLAGGAVLLQNQRQILRREEFQALVARRGWSLNIIEEKLGRPATLRIASRSGLGWTTAVLRRNFGGDPAAPPIQITEYDSDEPQWTDGLLVIGPPIADPALDANLQPATAEGQRWIARTLGEDIAKYSAVLRRYPAPPGLSLFATADPAHRIDMSETARRLAAWQPAARGDRGHPILILGPDGMRLRMRHGIARADQMERFIDLALELGRIT